MDIEAAEKTARELLTPLPRRLAHVAAVAARAVGVARDLDLKAGLLVSAAWLHDIGYAPVVSETGFHALDGARFLRKHGVDDRVVNLVAHHSHARLEAKERGMQGVLWDEFPFDETLPHDALCLCDMTTGPDGQRMPVHERLAEIRERYGRDDVVFRFITRAELSIVETVARVEGQLARVDAQST